ncbi:hypothetical protein BS17DRAFT_763592 [Gyrodon lividus]|nr:hypothetical protein BS17DRAFT_763592 [Gyrodon lividus]
MLSMPAHTSSQQPAVPLFSDSVNTALQYDVGNSFIWGTNGGWIPHQGYVQVLPPAPHQQARPQELNARGQLPSEPMNQAFEYSHRDGVWSQHPPGPMLTHTTDNNTMPAPVQAATNPLPQGLDNGYIPSPKVAGARRPGKDSNSTPSHKRSNLNKGKGKENIVTEKSKKQSQAIIKLDDDKNLHMAPTTTLSGTKLLFSTVLKRSFLLGNEGGKLSQPSSTSGLQSLHALETKFKQLVKTTKPTGNGECPPEVTHAHHIDSLINEHAGTCDLEDSDFNDAGDTNRKTDNSSNEEDEPKPECHTAVACSLRTEDPPAHCNAPGAAAADLMTHLSTTFDPAIQSAPTVLLPTHIT